MRSSGWQVVRTVILVAGVAALNYGLLAADVRYVAAVPGALVVSALAVQIGLASVWGVIGRDHLLTRLCAMLAAGAGVWWVLREWNARSEAEMAAGFWIQAVLVIGTLILLRTLGFCTVRAGELPSQGPAALLPRFSMMGMLLLTGFVCVSLGIVTRMQTLCVTSDAAVISCIVGLFQASLTLAAVAATLIFRHFGVFVLLVCGGSALVGWGIGRAIDYDELVATVSIAAPVTIQTAVLLAARLAGYRFVRPGASEPVLAVG